LHTGLFTFNSFGIKNKEFQSREEIGTLIKSFNRATSSQYKQESKLEYKAIKV